MPARHASRTIAACLLALVGVVLGSLPVAASDPAPASRPNIVVFYFDDAAPVPQLWNDPTLTPHIYEQFIAHGLTFDNSIGEDPLCCPARGNVLTGQHTHNNRVTWNSAALFDPAVHIGKSMLDAGYASMFIGKYLNRDNQLTPEQWAAHDAGWTVLDVITGINGAFWNYPLHTKDGDFQVKALHSTQMVGDRAVMHFRETPAETPIFAMLSIYNLHNPNTPLPEFKDDPRCASMPPWHPPNYNEDDVSDKPTDIQKLDKQPYSDGWPLDGYCLEMLGIDKIVGQVTDELAAEGRLDNTLLVFTADNGMTWGQHRLGQQKIWPYATPIPLYMRWPAGHWGDTPQNVSEIVSNIDYAPTFCDLAETCQLTGYARGSTGPDGKSLVDLLNGDAPDLGRDAVLEESYTNSNSWAGLRTTALFDATQRWHYIEYTNGELELYDLVNDPWELQNLAGDSGKAALIAALHARLEQLRVEGIGQGTGWIRIVEDALPDTGTDFSFSGDLGSFVLDDDADPTLSNEQTFTNLQSGPYTITRSAVDGWNPAAITCDGVGAFAVPLGKVTVYLHPDETVTCTYVDAVRQPDLMIALSKRGTYKKDDFYKPVPHRKQTQKRFGVKVGQTYKYWIKLQNDSLAGDTFVVSATSTGPETVTAVVLRGSEDVTGEVLGGNYDEYVPPGKTVKFKIRVTIGSGTPAGSRYKLIVSATSENDPAKIDVVRAVAVR